MAAYAGIEASQDNIVFPYADALAAARDLWALAGEIREKDGLRVPQDRHARIDWTGPKFDLFVTKMADERADAKTVAEACEKLANAIAEQWADARGQQNRINWARWVDSEISDDGYLENTGEFFAGENDYGDPPSNPETPGGPDFALPSGYRGEPQTHEFGP